MEKKCSARKIFDDSDDDFNDDQCDEHYNTAAEFAVSGGSGKRMKVECDVQMERKNVATLAAKYNGKVCDCNLLISIKDRGTAVIKLSILCLNETSLQL